MALRRTVLDAVSHIVAVAYNPLSCEGDSESLHRPNYLPWAEDDCELVSAVEHADRRHVPHVTADPDGGRGYCRCMPHVMGRPHIADERTRSGGIWPLRNLMVLAMCGRG